MATSPSRKTNCGRRLSRCEAGINTVAIHSHMTGEEPRIIFFHYGAVAQLRVLPKVFRKLCLLNWHTGKTSSECEISVGFCYKTRVVV